MKKNKRNILKRRKRATNSSKRSFSLKKNRKKLRKAKKHKLKINKIKNDSQALSESFKPKIKVIGIGGGGGSIVSEIGRSLNKATFVIADTDVRAFKKKKGIKNFLFGQELTHGLGTGLNTDLAQEAALREKEKIAHLFTNQDIIIFVTCLGGGLGSGATKVFLDIAKDFSGITFGIFTLPFRFEGKSKHRIAVRAQKELRRSLNVSITIPNERIFKIINEDTAIVEAFSMVNKSLIESLESLINLIQSPGLINIDFADLRAIMQGKGNLAFLNTFESSGKDRVQKAIAGVLHNPLYQDHFLPERVLFNIEGGKNLSMFEVDKISKAISEQNPKAKIIFGISKNQKYKNKIKTILLMTGPMPSADAIEKSEKKEVIKKDKVKLKLSKAKKAKTKDKIKKVKPADNVTERLPFLEDFLPSLGIQKEADSIRKISVSEKLNNGKKNLRRTALEIQEDQELEKNKKSKQEEEWEVPAFLRFKKIK